VRRPAIGLSGIVVVDNVARGPAIGGIRMAPDVTLEECLRLARAMTLKNAAAGLAHGGGKAVIAADPRMPAAAKEAAIRAFAQAIAGLDDYVPGPDMGTDERCMAWIHDEIARAVGLPRAIGGIPLDEIGATGWGLLAAVEVAAAAIDLPLAGARLVVQGFGAVGRHAARFLAGKGAVVVAASDSRGAIVDPQGLDVAALDALKRAGRPLHDHDRGDRRDGDALLDVPCDIWIPAARPDVLTSDNVGRLRTRLVVEGANIPATPDAEAALHARGILVVPDFIANAGGVITAAVELHGGNERTALETVADLVRTNTASVIDNARRDGVTLRAAALRLAEDRVRGAMALRRWR
ncbi:MAG: Glu/Leu/Phe/Val dehydrogenase, partial [Alphaproteobacteria bacterium]|nr:Glu/Leu/Phe/Val dehydrogenase [Alphaproteobacteria bacterium]